MAGRRESYTVPGMAPDSPAPAGARVDNLVYSSSLVGRDPETGQLGATPESQLRLAYQHARTLMEMAGGGPDDILYVTNFIRDQSLRPLLNEPWLELFPESVNRPARKTTCHPLPDGQHVQLQVFGVLGGSRQPLELPGLAHRDPLPMGALNSGVLYSSVIGGQDPARGGANGETPERQLALAFDNLLALVQKAGGTTADIAHVWVFLKDFAHHDAMLERWLAVFPEDGQRPARKTIRYDLQGDTLVQLQATAILGGQRENLEVHGIGHQDPIPLATKTRNVLISSGVAGHDPASYTLVDGLERQTGQAFANVESLLAAGGGTLDDVAHVTVLVKSFDDLPVLDSSWNRAFPDPASRPARHVMPLGLPGQEMLIQHHVIAVTA